MDAELSFSLELVWQVFCDAVEEKVSVASADQFTMLWCLQT